MFPYESSHAGKEKGTAQVLTQNLEVADLSTDTFPRRFMTVTADIIRGYYNNKRQLQKIARNCGMEFNGNTTKNQLLTYIDEVFEAAKNQLLRSTKPVIAAQAVHAQLTVNQIQKNKETLAHNVVCKAMKLDKMIYS